MNIIVRMRHVRDAEICAAGAREFCKKHGLDWNEFLENGFPIEVLEVIADANVLKVTDMARKEKQNGRQQ